MSLRAFLSFILLAISIPNLNLLAITSQKLHSILLEASSQNPFSYPLNLRVLPSPQDDAEVMICLHGYGGDYRIADTLRSYQLIPDHLVSFNFPSYDTQNPSQLYFGTIHELLPALYVIKQCVIEGQLNVVNLYGFSAGGGAIINLIAVLNSVEYKQELAQIGMTAESRAKILKAIEQGIIILDSPLKSIDEVMTQHHHPQELELPKLFLTQHLRPIDSIEKLKGLKLTLLLYFQNPDEVLSNRDDDLFIERLKKYNQGRKGAKTRVIVKNEGGHVAFHRSLWEAYSALLRSRSNK
jgi:hypothetical protein